MCEKPFAICVRQPEGTDDVTLDAVSVRRLVICEDYRGVTLRCNSCSEFVHVAHGVNPNWRETGNAILYYCSACGRRVAGRRGLALFSFLDTLRHALNAWEGWQVELRAREARRNLETGWIADQLKRYFVQPTESVREAPKPPNHKQRRAIANRQSGWDPKRCATA